MTVFNSQDELVGQGERLAQMSLEKVPPKRTGAEAGGAQEAQGPG